MTNPQTARAQSFALLIDLGTKLQVLADRAFAPSGFTTRQWFLCLILEQAGKSLSLKETAKRLGTSHQNAKQLAIKLERKGYIRIEKDTEDARSLSLSLTESCKTFWAARRGEDTKLLATVFRGLGDARLSAFHTTLTLLELDIHRLLADDSLPFSTEEL